MSKGKRWTINDLGKWLAGLGDEGEFLPRDKRDATGSSVVIVSVGGTVFKLFLCEMVDPLSGSSAARTPPKKRNKTFRPAKVLSKAERAELLGPFNPKRALVAGRKR